jgi:hypothetical protein
MKRSLQLFILFIAIALSAVSVFAATLSDYRERVERAASYSSELPALIAHGPRELERETIADLGRLLPPSEQIDAPGGRVEVDNRWLRVQLSELEKENDVPKRQALAAGISERLSAIGRSLAELDAAAAAERSKDEDKQKLAEILRRAEYQKAEAEQESLFQRWWRALLEWLESVFPSPSVTPGSGLDFGGLRTVLQVVVFALLIALIGFLAWRFLPLFSDRFGGKRRKVKADRVILGELIEADVSSVDLFSEAERLAVGGDFRGAIRKGYIAVLCELGDRKAIRLARHKTNRDYLRDVEGNARIVESFTGMTQQFERTWYGSRVAAPDDWVRFSSLCRQAVSRQ